MTILKYIGQQLLYIIISCILLSANSAIAAQQQVIKIKQQNKDLFIKLGSSNKFYCLIPKSKTKGEVGIVSPRFKVGGKFTTISKMSFAKQFLQFEREATLVSANNEWTKCVSGTIIKPPPVATSTPTVIQTPAPIATNTPLPTTTPTPVPACSDGADNDGDGKVDLADQGCVNSVDGSESDNCGNNYRILNNIEHSYPEYHAAIARTENSPLVNQKSAFVYSGDFELPRVGYTNEYCHDQIPQQGVDNLECHLDLLRRNLPWRLGDRNFTGVVIIDVEAWDPVWDNRLPSEYKIASRNYVTENNSGITDPATIDLIARAQWQSSATQFLLSILREIKVYAPAAKVGFYDMPNHYLYNYGYSGNRGAEYRARNDLMAEIWREVDIFAPETYLHVPVGTYDPVNNYLYTELDNSYFIGDAIREAQRLREQYPNNQEIYTIGWFRYHDNSRNPFRKQFYNSIDIRLQLFTGRAAGANGVIIWGNEKECRLGDPYYQECITGPQAREFPQYFINTIEPVIRQNCSLNSQSQ